MEAGIAFAREADSPCSRSGVMIGAGVTHGIREPCGCASELAGHAMWAASWVLSSYTDRSQMGYTDRDNNCWTDRERALPLVSQMSEERA